MNCALLFFLGAATIAGVVVVVVAMRALIRLFADGGVL